MIDVVGSVMRGGKMKVYKFNSTKDKDSYKVPSTTTIGVYYTVDRLHTTADTYVFRCECVGFTMRATKIRDFECKHIRAVKEFLTNETFVLGMSKSIKLKGKQ